MSLILYGVMPCVMIMFVMDLLGKSGGSIVALVVNLICAFILIGLVIGVVYVIVKVYSFLFR